LPFDSDILTVNYLMERIDAKPICECCGKPLNIGGNDRTKRVICTSKTGEKDDASPSIDRIHPERGYTVANIAILCWRCNNLKRDATPTELKTVTDWMWTVWGNEVETEPVKRDSTAQGGNNGH
jgi:5-methylcytosine-specific restriction endonuclease McrA